MTISTSDPAIASLWNKIGERQKRNRAICREMLIDGYGVKVIHPDDGWVDRERNILRSCYPVLLDPSAKVGDLMALGSETTGDHLIGRYRVVRITQATCHDLMMLPGESQWVFRFEDHTGSFDLQISGGNLPKPESPKRRHIYDDPPLWFGIIALALGFLIIGSVYVAVNTPDAHQRCIQWEQVAP